MKSLGRVYWRVSGSEDFREGLLEQVPGSEEFTKGLLDGPWKRNFMEGLWKCGDQEKAMKI